MKQEIITRRNLPHWYMPGAAHFVTYRLAGTIPVAVLRQLRSKRDAALRSKPDNAKHRKGQRKQAHKQFFADYDRYLDQNRERDWLANPKVAAKIRENLYHHHGSKYYLLAYCVMPNHVHVLLQPIDPADRSDKVPACSDSQQSVEVLSSSMTHSAASKAACGYGDDDEFPADETPDDKGRLAEIMHSLKSYTANVANELLKRSGQFWQHESYDHWVRHEDELERIVSYIRANSVEAGLKKRPEDWFWCSCHDRFLKDGEDSAWLGWPQS